MKEIKIKGMTCQHCVMAVTKALNSVDGIKNVHVDLKTGTATFEETKPVDAALVKSVIEEEGYEVAG